MNTLSHTAPSGDQWIHEIKYDGYRLLVRKDGAQIACYTRNVHNWTNKFPGICDSIRRLPCNQAWLDGELVTMLESGKSCYGSLQQAVAKRDQGCLAYYVFDLLWLDGRDLCREPIEIRKERLRELIQEGTWNRRYVEHIQGHGPELFAAACEQKLEGIISKRAGSVYRPGVRSKDWLKTKWRGYHEHRDVKWEWWEGVK